MVSNRHNQDNQREQETLLMNDIITYLNKTSVEKGLLTQAIPKRKETAHGYTHLGLFAKCETKFKHKYGGSEKKNEPKSKTRPKTAGGMPK